LPRCRSRWIAEQCHRVGIGGLSHFQCVSWPSLTFTPDAKQPARARRTRASARIVTSWWAGTLRRSPSLRQARRTATPREPANRPARWAALGSGLHARPAMTARAHAMEVLPDFFRFLLATFGVLPRRRDPSSRIERSAMPSSSVLPSGRQEQRSAYRLPAPGSRSIRLNAARDNEVRCTRTSRARGRGNRRRTGRLSEGAASGLPPSESPKGTGGVRPA